jgi:hypothetical protein
MPKYDFDGYEDYGTAGILREHSRKNGSPSIDTGGRHGGHKLTCHGNATIGKTVTVVNGIIVSIV